MLCLGLQGPSEPHSVGLAKGHGRLRGLGIPLGSEETQPRHWTLVRSSRPLEFPKGMAGEPRARREEEGQAGERPCG